MSCKVPFFSGMTAGPCSNSENVSLKWPQSPLSVTACAGHQDISFCWVYELIFGEVMVRQVSQAVSKKREEISPPVVFIYLFMLAVCDGMACLFSPPLSPSLQVDLDQINIPQERRSLTLTRSSAAATAGPKNDHSLTYGRLRSVSVRLNVSGKWIRCYLSKETLIWTLKSC